MTLRPALLFQLAAYINNAQATGEYWGNRKQFMARHEELKRWMDEQLAESGERYDWDN